MSNLYLYLICSRNKDNKDICGFKQRFRSILQYVDDECKVIEEFKNFTANGLPGEKTRLYRSVNSRAEEKIRDGLIIRLLKEKPSMTKIESALCSVAWQACNRDESKWLFDFDVDDPKLMENFCFDINEFANIPLRYIEHHKTPHGYAIITPRGFDTRPLMDKWKDYDITLKRDGMLFMDMIENA